MSEHVFFYGTLMKPFNVSGRRVIDEHLRYVGRGRIAAAMFDLGFYPAAVPCDDGTVVGEVHAMAKPAVVLRALDEFEGHRPAEPELGLYVRTLTPPELDDGSTLKVWVYFYNAPLGRAERVTSGDYLAYLRPGLAGVSGPGEQP